MVTIHHLEVTFDVEGEGDEAIFSKLFKKHIETWSQRQDEMKKQRRLVDSERALGDRPVGEGE